ncbi:MAG TPA: DUF411 domain-containing protein [Candidatus Limnocylindrales bacterium]|jgi:hypothetical protein|nr:DUF411 domain-containing protein [Candidatus Limnocylindrales bacterium]
MTRLLRPFLLFSLAALLAGCAGAPAAAPREPVPVEPSVPLAAPTSLAITLVRSPSCGCCAGHADHLARAGYDVASTLTDGYIAVKDAHGIPADMRSCHTSLVGRYFVEGHVPAAAIEQLLRELPEIDGIALPGMPPGSPGMGGVAEGPLVVWAIEDGRVVGEFGRFAGVDE